MKNGGAAARCAARRGETRFLVREAADAEAEEEALSPAAGGSRSRALALLCGAYTAALSSAYGDAVYRLRPRRHRFHRRHSRDGIQHIHAGYHLAEHGILPSR